MDETVEDKRPGFMIDNYLITFPPFGDIIEEHEDGEYYITLTEDILQAVKLAPGDNIEWVDLTENTYLLRKVDE